MNILKRIVKAFQQINHIEYVVSEKQAIASGDKDELKQVISETIKDNWPFFNSIVQHNIEAQFHNQAIEREKEKKKPLFLIGNGPSLKDIDVSKLKNCYTMCFNRAYIAFKDWGFEPTYFASLDLNVCEDNAEEFRKLMDEGLISRYFFVRLAQTICKLSSSRTDFVQVDQFGCPDLNFNGKLNIGDSGLFGLQIALGILGFKTVYLLGCDASYLEKVPGIQIKGDKYISKKDADLNHFRPDYFGKGTVYTKPYGHKHYLAWKYFYESQILNNSKGYKVYNCAKEGKLQFFEYADFKKIEKNIERYEK